MDKILIANRGEVALRIIATCRRLKIQTVAVYSEADRKALHVGAADEAFCIGPAAVEQSYLNAENVLAAARASCADGIHPGYGFLSENTAFAEAVEAEGLIWIGPPASAMASMASKISARAIAMDNNVPVIPAYTLMEGDDPDIDAVLAITGLPLLIKSSAGGGGIGMRELHSADELSVAIGEAREQAERQFGRGDLLIERLIGSGRHIEIQVAADHAGNCLHLFERDCSSQRRRQKLLEETPAAGLSDALRTNLQDAAIRLARAVDYRGLGTVEFLVDHDDFFLLEMNTRLQVEHPVTEAVTGLDLVELQIKVARGQELGFDQTDIRRQGHAIEARIYAEDPRQGFRPATGTVVSFAVPEGPGVRVDTGIGSGSEVGHHYDGLLCKIIVHDDDREAATELMQRALRRTQLLGITTNQAFLRAALESDNWQAGMRISTIERNLEQFVTAAELSTVEIEQLLMVATIFQFVSDPPAADREAWPGAYRYNRQSSWLSHGITTAVNWRWCSARQFEFPDFEGHVQILDRNVTDADITLEINGQRQRYVCRTSPGAVWLWNGQLGSHALHPVCESSLDGSTQGDGRCVSHGPGQVLRILVTPGESIEQGAPLVVIESMKMESTLTAPVGGAVTEIPVSEGDLISSGQLLVRLQADKEAQS
jgi:acetyl/propionyl-CoA carboxylase alpha subunit